MTVQMFTLADQWSSSLTCSIALSAAALLGLIRISSGVSGCCRSSGDTYVRGRELITISTSIREVTRHVNLARPVVFLKHHFVEWNMLSNMPPHQGAFSTLNFHWTSRDFTMAWIAFAAALNVCPLSDTILLGKPRLAETSSDFWERRR